MAWKAVLRLKQRGALLGTAAAIMMMSSVATAQAQKRYDIPAGEISKSVQRLAMEAGVQVMVPEADTRGLVTKPVNGEFTPIQALQRMLEGTGLSISSDKNDVFVIRRVSAEGHGQVAALDEDIVVTGSRIARAGFDTLQAAMVEDAAQIEKRGYVNVAQALEANPLFGTSISGAGNSQSPHGTGQRYVNMFGLGSQRTLTLVNGRRFVSANSAAAGGVAPAGSQVDLNLIPASLVERVETIAIGGAPIYGSDAIAGTVNIILKNDYQGIELSALSGISDRGNAEQYSIRGLAGTSFAEGRGNIVVALDYTKQGGLLYRDGIGDWISTVPNLENTSSSDGISALKIVSNFRYPVMTEGGLPYFSSGAAGVIGADGPGVSMPSLGIAPAGNYIFDSSGRPLQFGPGGDLVPFNPGIVARDLLAGTGLGTLPLVSDGGDGFSQADNASLLTPTKRVLGNVLAHYDISSSVRVFFEGAYSRSNVVRSVDLFAYAAPGLLGGPQLTFSVDNPFLTDQARATLLANGLTSFNMNRNLRDIITRDPQRTRQEMYRMVGGFEGAFDVAGERWNWDLSYNYGRIRNHSRITYVDPGRLLEAANAVAAPDGTPVCASGAAACVPINLFGYGSPSDAAMDYVSSTGRSTSTNTQTVLTANVGGRLPFGLSSMPISFNVGAEHRTEKAVFDPNDVMIAGITILGPGVGGYQPVEGKFNTKELYGELVVPIIADGQDFPLIRSADLEGSIRYVDHSVSGGAVTWSAGGQIYPRLGGIGEGLSLRGVYTRAIRSPAISELFTGVSPVTQQVIDPCSQGNYDRGNRPSVRAANCTAALAAVGVASPADFSQTTNTRSPSGSISGNPDLDNEKARSWSVGVVYQPPAVPSLRLAADWTSIKLDGGIESLTMNNLLEACYDSTDYPTNSACSSFRRLTAADIASGNGTGGAARVVGDIADGYTTGFVNTSKVNFSGLIVAADYAFDLGGGGNGNAMRLGAKVFYTDKYDIIRFAGQLTTHNAGTLNYPKWRIQANGGVTVGDVDFDLQLVWRDKTKFDLVHTIEDTPVNDVGAYTLVNGTVGWTVSDRFRFKLIVNNMFDRDIPYSAVVRRNFSPFDVLGRTFFVNVATNF